MLNKIRKHIVIIFPIIVCLISTPIDAREKNISGYDLIHQIKLTHFIKDLSELSLYQINMNDKCVGKCGSTLGMVETGLGEKNALSEFEYINGAPIVD